MPKDESFSNDLFAKTDLPAEEEGYEEKTQGIYFSKEEVKAFTDIQKELGVDSFYSVVKFGIKWFLKEYAAGKVEIPTTKKVDLS